MDLRIVNTCNNNCLYCLEWILRREQKFISKYMLFSDILASSSVDNITFYWWNPLLHPDLYEIVKFCNRKWFWEIWLLSNTATLEPIMLNKLIKYWLNMFWFYFNSFDKVVHEMINWWWIIYKDFLNNIDLLARSWINLKTNIYLNKLNIDTVFNDLIILRKKYWVKKIDFIWFFPFDKPYEHKDILYFNFNERKSSIYKLFSIIKKLGLDVNFMKFNINFFWGFKEYYNFQNWILNQIWVEDVERLSWNEKPFCFTEDRCEYCFIQDKCKFYVRKI